MDIALLLPSSANRLQFHTAATEPYGKGNGDSQGCYAYATGADGNCYTCSPTSAALPRKGHFARRCAA